MRGPATGRLWAATAFLVGLLVLAAWFLVISPQRAHLGRLRADRQGLEAGNERLRADVAQLQAGAADLPERRTRLAELGVRVPADPELPALLQALEAAAQTVGVELVSVTPQPPEPLPQATSAVPATAAAPIAPATGTPATPTPVTPTPATPPSAPESSPAPATPAPVASDAAGQPRQIPLTVVVRGGYVDVAAYLDQIENLPRTVLLTSVTVAAVSATTAGRPPGEGGRVEATVRGRAFVQGADPLGDALAPTGPPPTSTPTAAPRATVPAVPPDSATVPAVP